MNERTFNRAKHERERANNALSELLESSATDKEKIATILAYVGAKPMSQISVTMGHGSEHEAQRLSHELHRLGLSVQEQVEETVRERKMRFRFSRDPDVVQRMTALESQPGYRFSQEYHAEIGRLLGFPPTAIAAYLGHQDMIGSLPDEIRDTPLGRFVARGVMMRFSKTHWREEMKTMQKWFDAAQAVAPEYVAYLISDDWVPPGSEAH